MRSVNNKITNLKGKTIENIAYCAINKTCTINFTDGTNVIIDSHAMYSFTDGVIAKFV